MSAVNETSVCLTAASEEMLLNKIMARSFSGFRLNKIQVKGAAKKVLIEAYKGHSNKRELQQQLKVTDEWFLYFTGKYPSVKNILVDGKHGKSSHERKSCSTQEAQLWHENLLKYIRPSVEEETLDKSRVFLGTVNNFLFRDRIGKYVLRGMRDLDDFEQAKSRRSDENLACITTFNAEGKMAPLLLSFKSNRISPIFKHSMPKEWSTECNTSGWADTNALISFMNKFAFWLKKSEIQLPVILVLIMENLYMHIDVTNFCEKNGIILCCLPKNIFQTIVPDETTLNVLSRIKSSWKLLESVTRPNFSNNYAEILNNIPESVFTETFKLCGLFPLKRENLDLSRCDPESYSNQLTKAEQTLDDLEKVLPQRTLLQFQSCYPYRVWLNHSQNTSLFQAWVKLKKKARGINQNDLDDMYDEEYSDEIPECAELDLSLSPPSPEQVEAEMAEIQKEPEPDPLESQSESPPITESDEAVANIQQLDTDDVHDTIAIALANMGEMEFSVNKGKRNSEEEESSVPLKITRRSLHNRTEGHGVITSLMQNKSPISKLHIPSMPLNPSTPRAACKIITSELAEASVDRRVAAGVSFRAKVPDSVLAALRNNTNPNVPKRKRGHISE
ncbi:uncharacterized protein LOC132200010 [Neocloeon triangulifer]|uniref:uncharacterized protein LOC132200010 n=1 Tax=Neocloeon triangulifer TaxID=2078957 RepID=UPI00286EECED|nr:uncharacterized protein LOC132200010 [Neocloeon triangulifer]